MLEYLLDPGAADGQGRVFLDQLLALLEDRTKELRQLRFKWVTTEHPTSAARRIDSLVWLDGWLVGIENKPWAVEQDAQCGDYCKELQRLSPERWTLVFLTGDGRTPTSGGSYDGKISPLRYDQLVSGFKTDCKPVQAFLADFKRYMRERINGEAPASDSWDDDMINELLKPENMDVTVEVLTRVTAIRRRLLSLFREKMLARVRGDFGEQWNVAIQNGSDRVVVSAHDFDRNYSGLYFFKAPWEGRYAIGFSNQSANAQKFNFGVYYGGRVSRDRLAAGRLQADLSQAFGIVSKGTDYWDWERPLRALGKPEYDDWYEPEVTRRMALDGGQRMADDLYPTLKKTIEIAEPMIDSEPNS